jgi:prolyl-tRNA synthetase
LFDSAAESSLEYTKAIEIYDEIFKNIDLDVFKHKVYQYGITTEFCMQGIGTQTTTIEDKPAVEVGHLFNFDFDIFKKHFISFGIGISRLFHMLVEVKLTQNQALNDSINPLDLIIVPTSTKLIAEAEEIYEKLTKANLCVLLDNREQGFGEKIRDAENLKPKQILIVGKNNEYRKFNNKTKRWEVN